MKPKFKIFAAVLLIAISAWVLLRLRQKTAHLERHAGELRRHIQSQQRLSEDNRRLQTLLTQLERNDSDSAAAIRADILQARREVSALEQRARESLANAAAHSVTMEANRDPEKGVTRLEHFQNVGRVTPGAAFQTLVWAAIKGDDATLVETIAVTGVTREKAEALLARLPADARAKYPTPESLAGLAVTSEMLRGGALQITGYTIVDPRNATVSVRTNDQGKEALLPMQFSPHGWQMVVPQGAIAAIERRMSEQGSNP